MISRTIAIVLLPLWTTSADAESRIFQHWQTPHYGCGQWSRCYVRALSRERMSGMVTRFSGSYWTTRR
jgi:hypothetical protein